MRPRLKDKHLPPCVHHRHGAFWYVKAGKWTRLGAELGPALAEYARLLTKPSGRMDDLVDAALKAKKPRIAANTYTSYVIAGYKIKHMLQDMAPHDVLPRHIADVRMKLADTPNMANRVLSVLTVVFDYALDMQLVDSNPAKGMKRYDERERERLILPDEYRAIYAAAAPRLQIIMDLCYFTGQRVSDVLGIRYADLGDDGITFKQQKTGSRLVVRWTPELREVVDRAKALHGNVRALTLLHNRRGVAPGYDVTWEQWKAACAAAGVEGANLHDIRAMSGTAAEEQGLNPQKLLGHKSERQTQSYLRAKKPTIVDGPSFGLSNISAKKSLKNQG